MAAMINGTGATHPNASTEKAVARPTLSTIGACDGLALHIAAFLPTIRDKLALLSTSRAWRDILSAHDVPLFADHLKEDFAEGTVLARVAALHGLSRRRMYLVRVSSEFEWKVQASSRFLERHQQHVGSINADILARLVDIHRELDESTASNTALTEQLVMEKRKSIRKNSEQLKQIYRDMDEKLAENEMRGFQLILAEAKVKAKVVGLQKRITVLKKELVDKRQSMKNAFGDQWDNVMAFATFGEQRNGPTSRITPRFARAANDPNALLQLQRHVQAAPRALQAVPHRLLRNDDDSDLELYNENPRSYREILKEKLAELEMVNKRIAEEEIKLASREAYLNLVKFNGRLLGVRNS